VNGTQQHPISLAALIRAGDPDAVAGFYDGRAALVTAYCAEICPPESVGEATLAAFIDFLARVRNEDVADGSLDQLLLKGTRGAAAGRAVIERPAARFGGRGANVTQAICRGMPDLLAALANGELPEDESKVREHVARCETCRLTVARMEQAEHAFSTPPDGGSPAPEIRTALLDVAGRPIPPAPAAPDPIPPAPAAPDPAPAAPAAPDPAPAAPIVVRRRTGGLVGAGKQLRRKLRS
jgi:hypothetical protein